MPDETLFAPPINLEQWSLADIDKLVELRYPESDSLEFKENVPNDFERDICGLANSSGGFVVFGLRGKDKAEVKVGLPVSEEHTFNQKLTSKLAQIEPTPTVPPIKVLKESDRFYAIIKIDSVAHLRPFSIRNQGSFYVRLNGTTQPASRTIILNLFTESIGRRQRLIVLKNALEILIREIQLRKNMGVFSLSKDYTYNISEINVERLKDYIVNTGDLIFDLDETGKVDKSSITGGLLTTTLPKIDELNSNIKAFNNSKMGSQERANSVQPINYFGTSEAIGIIDGLTKFEAAVDKLLGN